MDDDGAERNGGAMKLLWRERVTFGESVSDCRHFDVTPE
jgi:hypothetical protein